MSDHPFGFDTLTISAVLVAAGDHEAAQGAAGTVGFDAVRLPAVLVPAGGAPPAGDYVMLGVMTQAAIGGSRDANVAPPVAAVGASVGATAGANREAQPKTRHRTAGGQPPPPGSVRDPVAVGVAAWRGMRRRPSHAATRNPPAPE